MQLRRPARLRTLGLLGLALLLSDPPGASAAEGFDTARLPAPSTKPIDFKRDIYPLLHNNCFKCHQGSDASSEIRLDSRAVLLGKAGAEPLAIPGKSADSRLIHLTSGLLPGERMPPEDGKNHPLTPLEVGVLRAWIDQGLKWDDKLLPPPEAAESHWAFRPVKRPTVPAPTDPAWVRTPVDSFIAAAHAREGLAPSPPASPAALIRRLSLDLTGLPPQPDDVAAFVADPSEEAYAKVVEKLLASPHYGERWGRHWLDIARYAESEGYESNKPRNFAWRYRDWVVDAFNADKPYDKFLREQIAGDELVPYKDANLVATGFLAAARLSSNEEDKALQRNEVLVDVTNATAAAALGLTFNCAQCHSHKFDPITAADYYRFQAFFVKGQPNNLALQSPELWKDYEAAKPLDYDPAVALRKALAQQTRERLKADARKKLSAEMQGALDTPDAERTEEMRELARQADLKLQFNGGQVEKNLSEEDKKLYDALTKKIDAHKGKLPTKPQTWGFYSPAGANQVEYLPSDGFYPLPYEPETLAKTRGYVLVRGDVHTRGPAVEPGWPAIFGPVTPEDSAQIAKAPRTALADWLARPANPLTARVWANRVWHYHFGRGIVATPGDFGLKGAAPSHPELLDWLATELVEHGWSTKHLHRLICLSATYRQGARPSSPDREAEYARLDPQNSHLWRWSPRRIESEAIRDSVLATSGELDRKLGGPGVAKDKESTDLRRSLYLEQKRDEMPLAQTLFDGPTANESCAERLTSTVSLQPLYLLNSTFMLRRAEKFAAAVEAKAGDDRDRQIETAFQIALCRTPSETERAAARSFFSATAPAEEAALPLVHFCHALLNVNEFLYLD